MRRRERMVTGSMAKTSSTAKGFALLSATGLICKILSLIYIPIQTFVVHDQGNGVIALGLQVYGFMFSLSNAGLPSSISKMVSERDALGDYRGSKKIFHIATAVLLVMGVLFSILLCIGAKAIAKMTNTPQAGLMLMTISPAFLFTSVNCAVRGYFQGKKNMAPTAVSNVIEQFFNSLMTVTFVALFYHMTSEVSHKITNAAAGSAIGTVSGALSASVFLLYILYLTRQQRARQESLAPPSELSTNRILRMIARYSIPAIISAVASNASPIIDAIVSKNRMEAGHISAVQRDILYGQYMTNYQRVISLVTFLATALMVAIIPAVSSAMANKDRKSLHHTIYASYKALFIFTVPCLAGFTVLARPIISFILFNVTERGDQFMAAWAWSNLFLVILSVQSGILIGLGRPMSVPVNLLLGMSAKLFFNYVLISNPAINMHGAAIGSAVGWFITVLLDDLVINRAAQMRIRYFKLLIKPGIVACVMGAGAFLTYWAVNSPLKHLLRARRNATLLLCNDIALLVAIAVGAALYLSLLILWNGIRREDILRVPKGEKLYALLQRVSFFKRSLG